MEAYTWLALEEVAKGGQAAGLLDERPARRGTPAVRRGRGVKAQLGKKGRDDAALRPFAPLKDELEKPFADRVFLWPRQTGPKGDLVDDEMGRVLQVPGWSNIFTQPIINRIEMLSTGVRTDIGVKVFGPDLDTIDRVCKDIEAALKPINGARDVIAAPIMGKGYLQIDIDRTKAARYGITVEDIKNKIEVALGGRAVTYTVENRDRFPVRLRYPRSQREDEETVRACWSAAAAWPPPAWGAPPAGPGRGLAATPGTTRRRRGTAAAAAAAPGPPRAPWPTCTSSKARP